MKGYAYEGKVRELNAVLYKMRDCKSCTVSIRSLDR